MDSCFSNHVEGTRAVRKQFRCDICLRSFSKMNHLERHRRSHTKEKPFKCDICGRVYIRSDTLLRHAREHTKPKTGLATSHTLESLGNSFPANERSEERLGGTPTSTVAISQEQALVLVEPQGLVYDTIAHAPLEPTIQGSKESFSPWLSNQSFNVDESLSPWLSSQNFNIDILDLFQSEELCTSAQLDQSYIDITSDRQEELRVIDLRHVWFTDFSHPNVDLPNYFHLISPGPSAHAEVDEAYRHMLHNRINNIQPSNHQLPSADFLNSCIRLYFSHLHQIFPFIHQSTFRPSERNMALLLSMCSVGCLFSATPNAFRLGTQLYETLQKSSMFQWEKILSRSVDESVTLVQASLIGQSFGILSGDAKHLAQVDALHGTIISWARRLGIFRARHRTEYPLDGLPAFELSEAWADWVRTESYIRICLTLQIQDAELAQIFRHEPMLKHNDSQPLICASKEVFEATSAEKWKMAYLSIKPRESNRSPSSQSDTAYKPLNLEMIPPDRLLSVHTILGGIMTTILVARLTNQLNESTEKCLEDQLMQFHRCFLKNCHNELSAGDLQILWHLALMNLSTDFDMIEIVIGRDGPLLTQGARNTVAAWASSSRAARCLLHAGRIMKLVRAQSLEYDPGLHTARALFLSGLSWHAFAKFASGEVDALTQARVCAIYPEFSILSYDNATLLLEIYNFKTELRSEPDYDGLLGGVAGLLRRSGHWRVSSKLADIIDVATRSRSNSDLS